MVRKITSLHFREILYECKQLLEFMTLKRIEHLKNAHLQAAAIKALANNA